MAKPLFVIKIALLVITVLDSLTNGDSFKLTDQQLLSTVNSTTITVAADNRSETVVPEANNSASGVHTYWLNLTADSVVTSDKVQFGSELILRISVFLYSCLAIAYLCDQFFVPSLEHLGKAFHLPPDISGPILIPIGTSGPEIFSSAISVFFTNNDIGTGAIIGGAVFNMLAIPAACGLAVAYFIKKPLKLDSSPILRDLLFYILSIVVLILVIKDNRVDLIDSSLLTLLFALYVGVMIYNAKLSMNSADRLHDRTTEKLVAIERAESTPLLDSKSLMILEQMATNCGDNKCDWKNAKNYRNGYEEIVNKKLQLSEDDDEDNDNCFMNNCFCSLILSPVYLIFWLTMPKRWPVLTFAVSIGWLTGLSYCTVWSVDGLSELLAIPQTISGMTLLAAGSAVPDLVTTVILIKKKGLASMGMCATIAANIYAIVVGLGLPWLLKCLVQLVNSSGDYSQAFITIESNALPYTSIVLLVIIFAFMLTLKLCKWKLYTRFSLFCAIIHIMFLSASISLEMFVNKS
ncbi:sodium/potassium/calcium exchanger 3-like [Oppia nitens]|uniref:sodium/potassium/calcium exchanger 3-like n=1 Tax=Oppia nitens TaxID=1686743 RepID=UPI0023DCBBEA|nr:sodium/potassium/calcium exchanger 3-like [Oppia nitens]